MEPQIHAPGSVRHAEKRRIGTCKFANRIAQASLDAYDDVVPLEYRIENKSQTCVAAVVAHFSTVGGDEDQGKLQVMGLGVGTKFLPDSVLREEESENRGECYGKRIRDCHAEVLAVRAFRRQLSLEILEHTRQLDTRRQPPNNEANGTRQREVEYEPIFELMEESNHRDCTNLESTTEQCHRRYRLKSNVTIHFYASSAPCGNATLKKFVKMEKEKFDASLGPDQWPEQTHEPIAAHSLRLGQFALLVKRDGSILSPQMQQPECLPETEMQQQQGEHNKNEPNSQHHRRKLWPCFEHDNWCPPSTSIPNFNKGTLHSCSDKICRWNCLGMQGSLLTTVLDAPIYMSTMTVGRKFSKIICQRALCCRANGFDHVSKEANRMKQDVDGDNIMRYRLNHPVLMETSVYMDESGTHDMTGIKHVGQDATFDSNLCWVWWPGKACNFGYAADCLECGLKINYYQSIEGCDPYNLDTSLSIPPTFSECSTYAMFQIVMVIFHVGCNRSGLSLSDLRRWKRTLSVEYESAKDELFRHRVFTQWCRRGRCS